MKKTELFITDKRMLAFMQYCVDNNIGGITSNKEWCDRVGFEQNNLHNVKTGARSFTKEQMYAAALELGMSMEYVFGFTDQIFRVEGALTPAQLLDQAVWAVKRELQNNDKKKKGTLKKNIITKK